MVFSIYYKLVPGFCLFRLPEPGSPFPQIFQRTVVVMLHPPVTAFPLQEEKNDSCQAAGRDGEMVVQSQSPVVKEERSDDTLGDVVGQTHFAVWNDFSQQRLHTGTVIHEQDTGYKHQHESKIGK